MVSEGTTKVRDSSSVVESSLSVEIDVSVGLEMDGFGPVGGEEL